MKSEIRDYAFKGGLNPSDAISRLEADRCLDAGIPSDQCCGDPECYCSGREPEPRVELRGEVAEKYLEMVDAKRGMDMWELVLTDRRRSLKEADTQYELAWLRNDKARAAFYQAIL